MTLLLHGEAGGWDELLIAVVGFAVLWIAVKLAGRKPVDADMSDGVHDSPTGVELQEEALTDPLPPPGPTRTKPG